MNLKEQYSIREVFASVARLVDFINRKATAAKLPVKADLKVKSGGKPGVRKDQYAEITYPNNRALVYVGDTPGTYKFYPSSDSDPIILPADNSKINGNVTAILKEIGAVNRSKAELKAVIPFEQCFCAIAWPDAEDYGADAEYSWIEPSKLRETLGYFAPEGDIWDDNKSYDGFLDRYIDELKAAYDKAVKAYKKDKKIRKITVGNSCDDVPKSLVPGLTALYTVWPSPGARGARYQNECWLKMVIARARTDVKFR